MRCAILTEEVLEAALRRRLSAEQRDVLLRHLREPCEDCLDSFEAITPEELVLPSDVQPSPEELEALLQRAAPARQAAGAPRSLELVRGEPSRRLLPRIVWGVAAAAALVALMAIVRPAQRTVDEGLKGAPARMAELVPLVGTRAPSPHVARALAPGGRLAPGELLLLRIRLAAPAWVYLLSQRQGEAAELIWPLQATTRHDAGEFELAESGAALAIDPTVLGTGGRLLLVASPQPIERRRLEVREPLHSREELERAFTGCAVDQLPVIVEPP